LGTDAYAILATEHFEQFEPELRRDLEDDFEHIRVAELASIESRFGESVRRGVEESRKDKIDDFVRVQFVAAAMEGLAQHGKPEDVAVGREHLVGSYQFVSRAALKVLNRFADETDVERLCIAARELYDDLRLDALRIALRVSNEPVQLLERLLSSESVEVIPAVIQVLSEGELEVQRSTLENLLLHDDAKARESALAYLVDGAEPAEMVEMLGRYVEDGPYYYNVVCWLDRLAYAEQPWRQHFSERLQSRLSTTTAP
jgi:HEAT repeat protein